MRKAIVLGLLVALAGFGARAQTQGYSILGADTLAGGSDAGYASFGWPDTSFGFKHGINDHFDAGVHFSLLYGVENTTTTQFGMALAFPLRFHLLNREKVSLAFHFDPGFRLYTTSPALFGFQFQPGVNLGVHVTPDVVIGAGADFWATLIVTGPVAPQFFFGPLIGPYVEFHVDPQLVIGFDTRFGAIIGTANCDFCTTQTKFGFRTQVLFAYKLQ
jgi:hypothetical protein